MNQSEKRVKTVVKGNNEWLESEEREAQKKILKSHEQPCYVTTNGRDPEFRDLPGSRHPTFPSQVSAGHKRITDILPTVDLGAPRAASARPARSTCAEPRVQRGDAGPRADIFFYRLPACLCSLGPPQSPRCHHLPEARRQRNRPPARKRTLRCFSSKKTLLGRPGRPARSPARTLGHGPALGWPALPRDAWGRAHRSPTLEAAEAATTPSSRVRPGPGATSFTAVAPQGRSRATAAAR